MEEKNKIELKNIEEQDVELQSGTNGDASKVPFCCVQVVPGNLDIDTVSQGPKKIIPKGDLKITFTPKLRPSISIESLSCSVNGQNGVICNIPVLRAVGCIEYALSTKDGKPKISGEKSCPQNAKVHVCCGSCVCVDNIIACGLPDNPCDDLTDTCDLQCLPCPPEFEVKVELNDAKVKKCPRTGDSCPDKKIIEFTGCFKIEKQVQPSM